MCYPVVPKNTHVCICVCIGTVGKTLLQQSTLQEFTLQDLAIFWTWGITFSSRFYNPLYMHEMQQQLAIFWTWGITFSSRFYNPLYMHEMQQQDTMWVFSTVQWTPLISSIWSKRSLSFVNKILDWSSKPWAKPYKDILPLMSHIFVTIVISCNIFHI